MTTNTWVGVTDTDWGTQAAVSLNWSQGTVPPTGDAAARHDVIINGSAPGNVDLSNTAYVKSIDFTGFVGTFVFDQGIDSLGSIAFSTGMTLSISGGPSLTFQASATLTTAGKSLAGLAEIHLQDIAGATLTMGDHWTLDGGDVKINPSGSEAGTLAFGVYTLTLTDGNLDIGESSTCTFSAGAKIALAGAASEIDLRAPESVLLPWIDVTTTSLVYFYNSLTTEKYTQSAGDLDLVDEGANLTTTGDCSFTGGTIMGAGSAFTVGGNFSTTGVDLDGLTIDVTGTATAHDCTISDCDFSGGTELDASDNCIDGGGNTNVSFVGGSVDTTKGAAAGAGAGF